MAHPAITSHHFILFLFFFFGEELPRIYLKQQTKPATAEHNFCVCNSTLVIGAQTFAWNKVNSFCTSIQKCYASRYFSLPPPQKKTDTQANNNNNNNNSNNIRALKWQVVTIYEYLRTYTQSRSLKTSYARQSVAVELCIGGNHKTIHGSQRS
jgi:hypothetical protein